MSKKIQISQPVICHQSFLIGFKSSIRLLTGKTSLRVLIWKNLSWILTTSTPLSTRPSLSVIGLKPQSSFKHLIPKASSSVIHTMWNTINLNGLLHSLKTDMLLWSLEKNWMTNYALNGRNIRLAQKIFKGLRWTPYSAWLTSKNLMMLYLHLMPKNSWRDITWLKLPNLNDRKLGNKSSL